MDDDEAVERMFDAVKGYVDRGFAKVFARLTALEKKSATNLEQRIATLEIATKASVVYRGVWKSHLEYSAGEVVTRSGTIWFCHTPTKAVPGKSEDWQLMVKTTAGPA